MTRPSPDLYQVDRLTDAQVAQFKRDGLLVLPGVLDLDLCRRARDQMWAILAEHRPMMQRDDPSTWGPISDEEAEGYQRPNDTATRIFLAKGIGFTFATGPKNCCWIWPRERCGESPNSYWARGRWFGLPGPTSRIQRLGRV